MGSTREHPWHLPYLQLQYNLLTDMVSQLEINNYCPLRDILFKELGRLVREKRILARS